MRQAELDLTDDADADFAPGTRLRVIRLDKARDVVVFAVRLNSSCGCACVPVKDLRELLEDGEERGD
jgi:hypothetical protein